MEEHRKSSHLFLPHLMPGQPMGWCFAFRTKSRDGGAAAEDKKKRRIVQRVSTLKSQQKKNNYQGAGGRKILEPVPNPGWSPPRRPLRSSTK